MALNLSSPPTAEQVIDGQGKASRSWIYWFNELFKVASAVMPGTSADNGNASITLTVGKNPRTQRWNTALTAGRTATLSTTDAFDGADFYIVREAGATGAFNLDVGPGLKTLTGAGQWCHMVYSESKGAWMVRAAGNL